LLVAPRQRGAVSTTAVQTVRADFPHTAYQGALEARHYAASGQRIAVTCPRADAEHPGVAGPGGLAWNRSSHLIVSSVQRIWTPTGCRQSNAQPASWPRCSSSAA